MPDGTKQPTSSQAADRYSGTAGGVTLALRLGVGRAVAGLELGTEFCRAGVLESPPVHRELLRAAAVVVRFFFLQKQGKQQAQGARAVSHPH